MKKLIIGCCLLGIVCLFCGCSQQYLAERLAYQANKLYAEIAQSSAKPNSAQFKKAIQAQQKILTQYPNWPGCGNAQFSVGHLYFLEGKYLQARDELTKVIQNYPQLPGLCLQARFYYGLTYERQDNWPKALEVYRKIEEMYPYTYLDLQIPLHIAQHYEFYDQTTKANESYEEAIKKYRQIISRRPHPQLVMTAEELLIGIYEKQKEHQKVLDTLQGIVVMNPGSLQAANALYKMAALYETLHRPQMALKAYRRFARDYPDHKLANVAKNKIQALKLALPPDMVEQNTSSNK